MTFVPTELVVKATGSLDKQVTEELKVPDPSPEEAKAILKEHEDTEGND